MLYDSSSLTHTTQHSDKSVKPIMYNKKISINIHISIVLLH